MPSDFADAPSCPLLLTSAFFKTGIIQGVILGSSWENVKENENYYNRLYGNFSSEGYHSGARAATGHQPRNAAN